MYHPKQGKQIPVRYKKLKLITDKSLCLANGAIYVDFFSVPAKRGTAMGQLGGLDACCHLLATSAPQVR